MPQDFTIAQAVVVSDHSGPVVVATSDRFTPELETAAVRAVARYGTRPVGVRVPFALFAVPVGRSHVAVVQVADLPGSSEPLGFRFLVLPRPLYERIGDPFLISDRFPPDWAARGTLPALHWEATPLPQRRIEDVARLLKEGDSAMLLGATQGLIDGTRVVLHRDAPDESFVRALWQLLPTRTRCELWPATFAFDLDLGFHVAAVPPAITPPPGSVTNEQARDYPEGQYELALQMAADKLDQGELDRLLARRSGLDVLKLVALLFAVAVVGTLLSKLIR